MREASRSWIASAKIARKAGQWQIAYSAMLQAQQGASDIAFVESAKFIKARGEAHQALRELENSMRLLGHIQEGLDIDLTAADESKAIAAKLLMSSNYNMNCLISTRYFARRRKPCQRMICHRFNSYFVD
jgi:hypothetical protein